MSEVIAKSTSGLFYISDSFTNPKGGYVIYTNGFPVALVKKDNGVVFGIEGVCRVSKLTIGCDSR